MFALDFLRVRFAHLMLLGFEMPLVGSPAVGVKLCDAKRGQQLLELEKNVVLPSSEHIGQDLARAVINGVPQPGRVGFAAHVTPHFIEFGGEPPPSIQFLGATDLHLHVLGMQDLEQWLVHGLECRFLFFSSVMTVLVLMCKTRAVSRIPLAFIAMATICCLISGD
jgi:hypothetical protein